MHRQNGEANSREIEQRIKKIISDCKTETPKKTKLRTILTTAPLIAVAFLLTSPFWLTFDPGPQAQPEPVRHKIQKVTIEYPEGLVPTIQVRPQRTGCELMPRSKKSFASANHHAKPDQL